MPYQFLCRVGKCPVPRFVALRGRRFVSRVRRASTPRSQVDGVFDTGCGSVLDM